MSIIDDSIQLQTSSLNSNIIYNIQSSPFSSYTPLILFNSSNTNIQYQLTLKQDTLTASTNLLGNGGSITAINWNNITTNKPTNFQADWNTTIINKPSTFPPDLTNIYTKTETNNLLNAKENVLTFSAPLTRTTNTIGINLNSYPSFTVLNSCNYITNTALINYPTYNVLNTCNYITNSTNGLINYPSFTVLNTCNYITNAGLINYPTYNVLNSCNYITNSTNGLINYPSFTVLNSSNFITSNTAYNTYLRLDGAVSMTNKLLLLTGGQGNPSFATNNGGGGDRIVFQSGVAGSVLPYSIGYSFNNLWISAPNTATINTYIDGSIKWSVGSTGAILYGILNATTLQEGGQNLSSKYLSSASLSNYVLKAGDTITGTLTANSVVANSFTEGGVLLSNKYITSASLDTTYLRLNGANDMSGKLTVLNGNGLNTPQLGDYGGTGDRIILWKTGATNYPYSFGMNNGTLWYSVPNGAIHNFYVNGTSRYEINSTGATVKGALTVDGNTLSLYSTTQLQSRLILSGQEFFQPANSQTTGIALLLGVNRTGNKQLWIADSTDLTQNATTPVLRLMPNYIDCIATDGLTPKPLTICGNLYLGANGVNIGMSTTSYKSSATVLTIARGTNGYSQPLVQITQNNGWDGNYALQVKGYANIGGDGSASGLRINGEDTGNTIFQNGNNPIGFTVNNSWMAFNTNGAERMRIAANGELFFVNNAWQRSYDNVYRMYYETNGRTYFSSGGNLGFTFRSTDQLVDAVRIENNGNIRSARSVYCDGNYGYFLNITANNYWNIYTGTTNGVANSLTFFHGASGIASYWYLNGTQNGTMSEISDKRSKINIKDFSALETIKKIKPKSFDVIDDKDIRFQYGFIAQDIEEIPELKKLVFTEPNYIANVNSYGSCKDNIIKANDDLTGKIEIGDEIKLVCDNNNKENQEFILDSTPYHNRYKRRYGKVTEIISPTEFKVDCEINKFNDDEFLIYGKKVEDAKSLDYNSFIALNTKAIQELYEIIERQQEQINLLLSNRNVIN